VLEESFQSATSIKFRRHCGTMSFMQEDHVDSTIELKATELPRKVAVDLTAAFASSLFVSPFISIIDKSIISNASGRKALWPTLVEEAKFLVSHPVQFFKTPAFKWVWVLYASTYTAANLTETFCEHIEQDSKLPKFVVTSAVNMSLCIAKDRAFTRMFGLIAPKELPLSSYSLFATRDLMTIWASFTLPKQAAQHFNSESALIYAQLLFPISIQFFSTPLHLLGLDLYNRSTKVGPASRLQFVSREYVKSTSARISRIAPAFGIGGISNNLIREKLK
jgi:hypothetical protein